jgi:hypothetical protein
MIKCLKAEQTVLSRGASDLYSRGSLFIQISTRTQIIMAAVSRNFHHSRQSNSGIVPKIIPQTLPSTSLQVHY